MVLTGMGQFRNKNIDTFLCFLESEIFVSFVTFELRFLSSF